MKKVTRKKPAPAKRRTARNQWQDHYAKQAKKDNYAARSVYKLKEIQAKFKLIRPGDRVIDLGCAPGSWLRYTAELVGEKGFVVGIDKKEVAMKLPGNAQVSVFDILESDAWDAWEVSYCELRGLAGGVVPRFNAVLSDMAPATTGNKRVDALKSFTLCQAALHIAKIRLVTNGIFICKIFQGEDFKDFINSVKLAFQRHKIFKPQSCRKASKEIYVIGIGKKEEDKCPDTVNGLQ